MKLSKSKINTYLRCPLEFKFQYIDKIEAKPNEYMILGTDVHLLAEKFVEKFSDDLKDVNIQNELINLAYELNLYDLDLHVDNLAIFFNEVFIENNYKLFSNEEHIYDDRYNFSGICDIILEDENGDLVVIDYKTSNSNSFSKYRLELCYYKLLVENVYNKRVSSVGIFFTKNGRLRLLDVCEIENKRKFLNSTEIDKAIETMQTVRNNINNNVFYPKKEFKCKFCCYYDICNDIV